MGDYSLIEREHLEDMLRETNRDNALLDERLINCEQKLAKYDIKIINESSPCSYEKNDSLFSWRRDKEKSLRNVCLSWF